MTDEELLAQASGLPVLYFDGFGAYRKLNGVLRSVGFTLGLGAQYNIVTSLAGAEIANRMLRATLDAAPEMPIANWGRTMTAH